MPTLAQLCQLHLLKPKLLIAPSYLVGNQWLDALALAGTDLVHLRASTPFRLAIDLAADEMELRKVTLATRWIGSFAVEQAIRQLPSDGYYSKLEPTGLANSITPTILDLRIAGVDLLQQKTALFEDPRKAIELQQINQSYLKFLERHCLVDEAHILQWAMVTLNRPRSTNLVDETLYFIPELIKVRGLEKQLLEQLPQAQVFYFDSLGLAEKTTRRKTTNPLKDIGQTRFGFADSLRPGIRFFRSVGDANQIREVLRRTMAANLRLDEIELLYTEANFLPLTYETICHSLANELDDQESSLPVTFSEGLPIYLSRPGRALMEWLRWIDQNFPQPALVRMIESGLLNVAEKADISFAALARQLRPLGIGGSSANYLPKIKEQLSALEKELKKVARKPLDPDAPARAESLKHRRKTLNALSKLIEKLIHLAQKFATGGTSSLESAQQFLNEFARATTPLDRAAVVGLREAINERRAWAEQLQLDLDAREWLQSLPQTLNVMASGPKPGCLHVASLRSGGHSQRPHLFIVGMDDRRFPGTNFQDPVLLDNERTLISAELALSSHRVVEKLKHFEQLLKAHPHQSITLSWSCRDMLDDRELFPSSALLTAYQIVTGQPGNAETLSELAGQPISFAPDSESKAIEESERWLWWLSNANADPTQKMEIVERRYGHLAQGRAARQSEQFDQFNGCVPAAGLALAESNPSYSASILETLGRCPLAFFFQRILQLYPLEEFAWDEERWLDSAQLGELMHSVFRQFMSQLQNSNTQATVQPNFEKHHQQLANILEDTVTHWRTEVPPPNESSFRTQYWQLVSSMQVFLRDEEIHCQQSQPAYFEVALGMESDSATPLDSIEPIELVLPNERKLRAKGRVDRVDKTGPLEYFLWDYKTGSAYNFSEEEPFRGGRRVQNILYLKMIEAALGAQVHPQAVVAGFGYSFPTTRSLSQRVKWIAQGLATGEAMLANMVSVIENGTFLATNDPKDCDYCNFRTLCGNHYQTAIIAKQHLENPQLVQLTPWREIRSVK